MLGSCEHESYILNICKYLILGCQISIISMETRKEGLWWCLHPALLSRRREIAFRRGHIHSNPARAWQAPTMAGMAAWSGCACSQPSPWPSCSTLFNPVASSVQWQAGLFPAPWKSAGAIPLLERGAHITTCTHTHRCSAAFLVANNS